MVRLTLSTIAALCLLAGAFGARAAMPMLPDAVGPSPEAARLLALQVTAHARDGDSAGAALPAIPRGAPSGTPGQQQPPSEKPTVACGNGAPVAAPAPTMINGMRFLPLHRAVGTHALSMPTRQDVVPTAQAVRAMVASNKNESALAQVALQTQTQPDAHTQAEAELAAITGKTASAAPATDPSALANDAVVREIERYRTTRGAY